MEEKPLGQVLFISKETGKQLQVELAEPFKIWPTEPSPKDAENPFVEEPNKPLKFTSKVTLKMPKKGRLAFLRLIRKSRKLPRKIRKALKHMEIGIPKSVIDAAPYGTSTAQLQVIGLKDGYPRTKWVRRAECLIKKNVSVIVKEQIIKP